MAQRPVKIDVLITLSEDVPVSVVHSIVQDHVREALDQLDTNGVLQRIACSEKRPKPVEEEWVMSTQTYHLGDGSYMGSR